MSSLLHKHPQDMCNSIPSNDCICSLCPVHGTRSLCVAGGGSREPLDIYFCVPLFSTHHHSLPSWQIFQNLLISSYVPILLSILWNRRWCKVEWFLLVAALLHNFYYSSYSVGRYWVYFWMKESFCCFSNKLTVGFINLNLSSTCSLKLCPMGVIIIRK